MNKKENCKINQDGIQIIVKDKNQFFTYAIDFLGDQEITNLLNQFLSDHQNLRNQWLPKGTEKSNDSEIDQFNQKVDKLYTDYIQKVLHIDPDYKLIFDYSHNIASSYEGYRFYSPEFLKSSGPINHYSIVRNEAYENYLAYMGYKTRKEIKKHGHILAYSHRFKGFNTQSYELNNQFKIDVRTNFGYGYSSYFDLILYYKEYPIIPYTNIVYYRYIDAYSLIHNTQDYPVMDESWADCFDFTVRIINDFNQGKQEFIEKYVVETIDEMFKTLGYILNTQLIFFVEEHKMNSILNFKQRHIIYDYKTLIENKEANNSINISELNRFINENTKDNEFICPKEPKNYHIIPDNYDNFDGLTKDRYVYTIATLLDKRYEIQGNYDISSVNNNSMNHVSKILKCIVKDNSFMIRKYQDYELYEFRASRIAAVVTHAQSIMNLSDLIDVGKYMEKIKQMAKNVLPGIRNTINILDNKINQLTTVVDEISIQYTEELSIYESNAQIIIYKKFINAYSALNQLFSYHSSIWDSKIKAFKIEEEIIKKRMIDFLSAMDEIHKTYQAQGNPFFMSFESNINQDDSVSKKDNTMILIFEYWDKLIFELNNYEALDIDLKWDYIRSNLLEMLTEIHQSIISNRELKNESLSSTYERYIQKNKKQNKVFQELEEVHHKLYRVVSDVWNSLQTNKNELNKITTQKSQLFKYLEHINTIFE
jgi:hypothetical protein